MPVYDVRLEGERRKDLGWILDYWWKEIETGGEIGNKRLNAQNSTINNFINHNASNKNYL